MYFTFDPGLTVTVNFIFTLREPNVYKPHGFFLDFLATFICFCVTVFFYRYLYFVVNQIKLQSKRKSRETKSILASTIDQCVAHSLQSLYKPCKTDFLLYPLLRMVYLNLQNVYFLLKGFCILRSATRSMVKTYNCSCNRNMCLW